MEKEKQNDLNESKIFYFSVCKIKFKSKEKTIELQY